MRQVIIYLWWNDLHCHFFFLALTFLSHLRILEIMETWSFWIQMKLVVSESNKKKKIKMWSWNEGWRKKVLVIKLRFLCSIQGLYTLPMNDSWCDLQGAVGIPRIHLSFSQLSIHSQLAHSHLSVLCDHFSVHALLREKKNHNLKYAPKNKQNWSPPQLKKPSLTTTLLSQALYYCIIKEWVNGY